MALNNAEDVNIDPALAGQAAENAPGPDDFRGDESREATPDATVVEDDAGSEDILEQMSAFARTKKFFVSVNFTKMEQQLPTGPRAAPKMKKVEDVLVATRLAQIFDISRADFVRIVLEAHGLEELYIVGQEWGPRINIHWKGSPGATRNAVAVETDEQWKMIQRQLVHKKVDTVNVILAKEGLEGFKSRKRVHSPDPADAVELMRGTYVPRVDQFTPAEHTLARYIASIKTHWPCNLHGACYIDDKDHINLTLFRLKAWGTHGVATGVGPEAPPPPELLSAWSGKAIMAPKPRGRAGPYPAEASSSAAGSSQLDALMTVATAMMVQSLNAQQKPVLPVSPIRAAASSPPPAVNEELERCLHAFGRARSVSLEEVDMAIQALDGCGFTAASIEAATDTRIREITGFTEGRALELKSFVLKWSGKIEAKRARRGL